MNEAPPTGESLFENAPRQSDYGFNSDGSIYNDFEKAAEKAGDDLPFYKQYRVGKEYYEKAQHIDKLFDGDETVEDLFTVIDESMTLAVNIVEAIELASTVQGATTPAKAGEALIETLIGTAISVGVPLLVEWLQPLKDLFGLLTGNPDRLRTSKSMWEALADRVEPIGVSLEARARELGEVWRDEAETAAEYRLYEGGQMAQVVAKLSRGMGVVLEFCASTFEKVQGYMVNRAADLVSVAMSALTSVATALKVIRELVPLIVRVYIEFLQIMLHLTRAFGTLVNVMNAAGDAAERMTVYIDAMTLRVRD